MLDVGGANHASQGICVASFESCLFEISPCEYCGYLLKLSSNGLPLSSPNVVCEYVDNKLPSKEFSISGCALDGSDHSEYSVGDLNVSSKGAA